MGFVIKSIRLSEPVLQQLDIAAMRAGLSTADYIAKLLSDAVKDKIAVTP